MGQGTDIESRRRDLYTPPNWRLIPLDTSFRFTQPQEKPWLFELGSFNSRVQANRFEGWIVTMRNVETE